jgi:hypothetical protein
MRNRQIKEGAPSVNNGRGGDWSSYLNPDTVEDAPKEIYTTRTGAGLGEGYTGTIIKYPDASGEGVPEDYLSNL